MKYYIVVGEASGDLHASNLMKAILQEDKEANFRFFGGNLMKDVGGTRVKHYKELAFMGFIPVLLNLRTILRNLDLCEKDILDWQPDMLVLVDYPGFNLKLAKYIKQHSKLPVVYYISPKIWAWKTYRIKSIKAYVDKVFSILPFEVPFYEKHNYPINYVGNPTVDAVANREIADESMAEFIAANQLPNQPILAVLPGSRKQEIKDNLRDMLEACSSFPNYQVVIAGAPGIDPSYYQEFTKDFPVRILFNQTYRILQQAQAALVTSGTATLETSLFRVPQTVCYKTPVKHLVSFVFERFFHIPYISLVNLIANKRVVKELFAKHYSVQTIRDELNLLLHDAEYRQAMLQGYEEVIDLLGKPGASQRAAREIVSYTKTTKT